MPDPETPLSERPAPDSGAVTEEALPHPSDPTAPDHAHPTDATYVLVALFLAVVTGAEVGAYYVHLSRGMLIAILVVLMVVKFSMVVLWFMHLRFDSRLFRRLFVTGLLLALGVYLIVLSTFHVWSR